MNGEKKGSENESLDEREHKFIVFITITINYQQNSPSLFPAILATSASLLNSAMHIYPKTLLFIVYPDLVICN